MHHEGENETSSPTRKGGRKREGEVDEVDDEPRARSRGDSRRACALELWMRALSHLLPRKEREEAEGSGGREEEEENEGCRSKERRGTLRNVDQSVVPQPFTEAP